MTTRYDLDALGWYQFEELCQALLKAELGLGAEAWGGRGDLGRDVYSHGPHTFPDRAISTEGPFLFQVKFVAGANAAGARPFASLSAAVRAECVKIRARISSGQWESPRHYVLMTNAPVSPQRRAQIAGLIEEVVPEAVVSVQGASDLDALLDANEQVRIAFPQVLGVRNLVELLESIVYRRHSNLSNIALSRYSDIAPVFVPTEAYSLALNRLREFGMAVLVGPPEVGKTTIARMIALARHSMGWDAYECRRPADFFEVFDRGRRQIFVADDAFGSTEYRPDIAVEWARELPNIVHAITLGRQQIVFTTRTGPLASALRANYFRDETSDFPDPGRVQIDVGRLSRLEKTLMLYRHCRHARLDEHVRDVVREEWPRIVDSPYFTPLRIARLVTDELASISELEASNRAEAIRAAMEQSLAQPSRAYQTSFQALPAELKRVLAAVVDAGPGSVDVLTLKKVAERHRSEQDAQELDEALQLLDEHFVRIE